MTALKNQGQYRQQKRASKQETLKQEKTAEYYSQIEKVRIREDVAELVETHSLRVWGSPATT